MTNVAAPLDYWEFQVAKSSPAEQQGDLGINWNTALGLMKDAYGAGMRLAVKCRFPEFAPADALDGVGWTLQIGREFLPTDVAYRAAMMNAWATHQAEGTYPGMVAALEAIGLANVAVWEAWYWSDGNPGYFFTITCSLPMPWDSFPMADGTWGDGDASKTWGDGGIWASGIPPLARAQLKAVITRAKPTHSVCAAVIVNLNTGGILYDVSGAHYDDGSVYATPATLYIGMTV